MPVIYKEYKKCPYCNSKINLKYSDIEDRLETVRRKFDIYECFNCGLAFTNPVPVDNLSILYPKNYLTMKSEKKNFFDLEKWYRYDQYRFDFDLVKRISGIAIKNFESYLDIGCGSGERVEYVKKHGCKKSFGLDKYDNLKTEMDNIFNSEILKFRPKNKFNVVSLFHVLEHLENFEEIVKHIKKNILIEDGFLIIQVPNYNSLERHIFGSKWFCFDVPRHIWHFESDFLKKIFKKNGFSTVGMEIRNAFLHPVSIGASIFKDADIQRIWVKRRGGVYRILWIISTIATIPFSLLENLFKKSSMLTLIFRSNK